MSVTRCLSWLAVLSLALAGAGWVQAESKAEKPNAELKNAQPAEAQKPPAGKAIQDMKPYLGVALSAVPEALRAHLSLAEDAGVMVAGVMPDSPASLAGVKRLDVITRAGDRVIGTPRALVDHISAAKPGDKLSLIVIRAGKSQTIEVTLGKAANRSGAWQRAPHGDKHADGGKRWGEQWNDGLQGDDHLAPLAPRGDRENDALREKHAKRFREHFKHMEDLHQRMEERMADLEKLFEDDNLFRQPWADMDAFPNFPMLPDTVREQLQKQFEQLRREAQRVQPRFDVPRGDEGPGEGRWGQFKSTVMVSDGEHTLKVERDNDGTRLEAKDATGKVIFEGPIDTAKQREAVPDAIRGKLDRLLKNNRIELRRDRQAEDDKLA